VELSSPALRLRRDIALHLIQKQLNDSSASTRKKRAWGANTFRECFGVFLKNKLAFFLKLIKW
jgi:hypothetical protein